MRLFSTVSELRHYRARCEHQTIGLVPTMGALHAGHLSLIEQARKSSDIVVVSIFVNPLQFGPSEDFDRYPRPQQADQALCRSASVDAIFMPSPVNLYGTAQLTPSALTQVVPPQAMTDTLCGRSRPGHFQGVATVVTKLLNITRPTYAFFGQKDAQQAAILKRLSKDLNLPGQIIICPTVREPDGLALSSRNRYLTASQRQQATVLYRSLSAAKAAFRQGEQSGPALLQAARDVLASEPEVTLDYLALVHPDTLKPLEAVNTVGMMAIAAYLGPSTASPDKVGSESSKTRLIDNIMLQTRRPIIAIDGPAGAGKSTVARQIAHRLALLYLDTGAMYRALTWFVLQQAIDPADEAAVARLLPHCHIQLTASVIGDQPQPPTVRVNGQDVTQAIRTATVTSQVSTVAAQASVRSHLVEQQQQYGREGGIVADGRDIGTRVFPNAELKIYLTASVKARAQRRYQDLQETADTSEPPPALDDLANAIVERDRRDSTRSVSPLRKAPDAIEIATDDLTADQVIEKISALYQQATA
ncbi:MAG: bifunctional pantoate--beta-alanine ligase/(d)CMP kinase [Phormidesmis sp.]